MEPLFRSVTGHEWLPELRWGGPVTGGRGRATEGLVSPTFFFASAVSADLGEIRL